MAKVEMALLGWIAPTDYGWYEFLSSRTFRDEVNFWTPSSYWTFRSPEFSPLSRLGVRLRCSTCETSKVPSC